MVYSIATLEPPVIDIFMNTVMLPEAERSAKTVEKARGTFGEVAQVLEYNLSSKPFLLGERFSAADVMVGSSLIWGQFLGLLDGRPVLADYAKRLAARPAYQRASAD
jgi:glutathione S-transferase